MNRTSQKIGRNERCPCGSGKKYKHCHLALDEQQRQAAAAPAPPVAEVPPVTLDLAQFPDRLRKLATTGTAKDRAGFADLLAKAGPILAYMEKQEEIQAASLVLEAHRAEFEKLSADADAYMDRTTALFAEECFAPLRFIPADIRRAFEHVGYPSTTAPVVQRMETLRAALLYLADKDRRSHSSMSLLLHLPDFVASGRYLDAWCVQQCSHQTAEFEDEPNPFLYAMFSSGYDAWADEKQAHGASTLRKLGFAPENLSGMSPEELDAWMQAQWGDPAHRAKIEAFMQQHPELHSDAVANLEAMQRDSVRLLDRPDATFLLLSPAEMEPWLPTLNERLTDAPEKWPRQPDGTLAPDDASRMLHEEIVPVLREMAEAIFTPARIKQLVVQIRQYRNDQFAAGDKAIASCATGAITSLERENEPGQNYFLISLCFSSLKPALISQAEGPGDTPP